MATLLEKAQEVTPVRPSTRRNITEEEVDLLIAVAKGEVTFQQAAVALGIKTRAGAQSHMYMTAFKAIRQGALVKK